MAELIESQPGATEGAKNLTPLFASAVQITVSGGLTRISFGEAHTPQEARFHTAIVIATEGAEGLAKLLTELIAKNKAENEAKKGSKK